MQPLTKAPENRELNPRNSSTSKKQEDQWSTAAKVGLACAILFAIGLVFVASSGSISSFDSETGSIFLNGGAGLMLTGMIGGFGAALLVE